MSALDQSVRGEVAKLDALDRSDLLAAWVKAYGAPPFKGARRKTLIRGVAYHIQCKKLGGLKPSIVRELAKQTNTTTVPSLNRVATVKPKPRTKLGTQLVREWNGRTHTVHVTDTGFVMGGITYGSLSAAAKAITGAHWSGPRFFGVTG